MCWTPHELLNQVILCLDESSNMLAICDKVKTQFESLLGWRYIAFYHEGCVGVGCNNHIGVGCNSY